MNIQGNSYLLGWIDEPSEHKGINFLKAKSTWQFWSYSKLSKHVINFASTLQLQGIGAGDKIAIILDPHEDFVGTFFAVLLTGGIPSVLAPPQIFQDSGRYSQSVRDALTAIKPKALVTESKYHDKILKIANFNDAPTIISTSVLLKMEVHSAKKVAKYSRDLAILQFTSGSSGIRRAVGITVEAVESNIDAIHEWLEWKEEDSVASWLPLYHDMGLIACFLAPIVFGSTLWLMDSAAFVRSPLRYLECFGKFGATLSAVPNFGLEIISQRVSKDSLSSLDFSKWRALVVGAETLREDYFHRFSQLLEPFYFKTNTLLPAYGLAEATLAVCGTPMHSHWQSICIDQSSLVEGQEIVVVDRRHINAILIVGCGYSLKGLSIAIQGKSGVPLG